MRVLVCNHHLRRYGGSETFTFALAREVARRGHEVDVFALKRGDVSRRTSEFARDVRNPRRRYDLILASHATCMGHLRKRGVTGFLIQTCHGIFSDMEAPVPGADRYVAVSEEVQDHLRGKGFPAEVIRNGIDCDRFRPREPVNPRLERVLSLCQGEEANQLLAAACAEMGLRFTAMNKFRDGIWDIEDRINDADLVVSLGRGAYEAMACARAVLVLDSRSYSGCLADGLVTPENVEQLLYTNLSGRTRRMVPGPEDVRRFFSEYDPGHGPRLRAFVESRLNVVEQADRYLSLAPKAVTPMPTGFWDRLREWF